MQKLRAEPPLRKEFYYLRHGETDWNLEYRGMGQQDIPLNAKGIAQARKASELLSSVNIETICHSPLKRAKVTAEVIAEHKRCRLVEIPDLIECSWGEYEGKVKGQWVSDWKRGKTIPGAEIYTQFLSRVVRAISKSVSLPGPVLIVSHGGVFWGIQEFARLGEHFDLPNASPVCLRPPIQDGGAWSSYFLDSERDSSDWN